MHGSESMACRDTLEENCLWGGPKPQRDGDGSNVYVDGMRSRAVAKNVCVDGMRSRGVAKKVCVDTMRSRADAPSPYKTLEFLKELEILPALPL